MDSKSWERRQKVPRPRHIHRPQPLIAFQFQRRMRRFIAFSAPECTSVNGRDTNACVGHALSLSGQPSACPDKLRACPTPSRARDASASPRQRT
jgi:hypothetical protein